MRKPVRIVLISSAVLAGLAVLALPFCSIFFMADFFSGPSEKECIKIAEEFLGCRLGKHYQFLDYNADYSHPDRPLIFSVTIPTEDFRSVIDFCFDEAEKNDGKQIRTEKKGYTFIETFSRTPKGFQKSQEVLSGDNRVHYQTLEVLLDQESISFSGSDY